MRLPNIGEFVRHHGTLLAVEITPPPPPPPPQKDYIFEEITARCELRLNGGVVKEIQTLNDFYGLETSVVSAKEEMKKYAEDNHVGPDSDLEVVVVRVASQFRARPKSTENFYDDQFFDFSVLDRGARWNLPEPVETIVWSSKTGDHCK